MGQRFGGSTLNNALPNYTVPVQDTSEYVTQQSPYGSYQQIHQNELQYGRPLIAEEPMRHVLPYDMNRPLVENQRLLLRKEREYLHQLGNELAKQMKRLANYQRYAAEQQWMRDRLRQAQETNATLLAQAKGVSFDTQVGIYDEKTLRKKFVNDFEAELHSKLSKQSTKLLNMETAERIKSVHLFMKKEDEFAHYILNKYLLKDPNWYKSTLEGKHELKTLDWYDIADIVDYIAYHTDSDEEFRLQLWFLFGPGEYPGLHPVMTKYLDDKNTGLKEKYHNKGYHQEQLHHYLAGVTGDVSGSHFQNKFPFIELQELEELIQKKHWNMGDYQLFKDTQRHRDEFVHGNEVNTGRFTVAPNIRRLLKPKI